MENTLDTRRELADRRIELIEEFKDELSLRYSGNPFRRGGIWTGFNPYEFWYLADYMAEHEAAGGGVTDYVEKLAQSYEVSKSREFARLLLSADSASSLTENPSFEEGSEEAPPWNFWNPDGPAEIERVEGIAHTGNSSVLFENTGRGGVYQSFAIQPGLLASQVHYYTPPGTETKGTIQLVIEAFNTDGDKLIYRSDTVPLSDTAGEWASVGFLEDIPETINDKEVTEILLNAQIHNAEDAQVYQDDLVVYQYVPSSADMTALVERFESNGEFESDRAAHALKIHLQAVDRFEKQGEAEKVIKHMNGFNVLLDHQKENGLISERAYNALKYDAESLVKQFIGADVDLSHIHATKSGDYPISVTLKNNTAQSLNVTLESETPEHMSLELDGPIQIEADQTIDIEGKVHLSNDLPEGAYEALIHVTVGGTIIRELPITVTYTSNLVKNSGFEELSDGLPLSWGAKDSWETGAVILTPEASRTGDNGIRMTTETSGNYFVHQGNIEVEGGNAYELSSWLRGTIEPNGKAKMKIEFYHSTEGNKKDVWSDDFSPDAEWKNVKLQALAPSDANRARIFLRLYGPGTVDYDDADFRLVEDYDYENLADNPGFEELNMGGRPIAWGAKDDWGTGAVVSSAEAARTGNNGIQMTTETTGNYFVFQENIKDEGDKMYELSTWLKSDISPNGRAQMKVEFYHETEGHKKSIWSDEYGSYDEWENIKMQAKAPTDANRARIFLRLYGPGTASYDDVSLRLVE